MARVMSVEVPCEIAHAARMDAHDLKRELAVHLFEQDKLSFGKAREMAEMTVWGFQQLLAERDLVVHYDVEEFEQDLHTLRNLGRI